MLQCQFQTIMCRTHDCQTSQLSLQGSNVQIVDMYQNDHDHQCYIFK